MRGVLLPGVVPFVLMVFPALAGCGSGPEEIREDLVIREPVIREPVIREPVIREPVIRDPVIRDPVIRDPVIRDTAASHREGGREKSTGARATAERLESIPLSTPQGELEEELRRTRPGRVLLRALGAHGGWDAWRRTPLMTVDSKASCENSSLGEDSAQNLLAAASQRIPLTPFQLVDRSLDAEYLGVEADVSSGKSYDKVRFSSREKRRPYPLVAYFDRSDSRLERLLIGAASQDYRLVVFSGQFMVGKSEVYLPGKLTWYFLERRDAHVDLEKHDCEEELQNIVLDPAGG